MSYLIEFRMRGEARSIARDCIFDLYRRFGVKGSVKRRPVPHVTLFGPFQTRRIQDVRRAIRDVAMPYNELHYEIDGFGDFDEKHRWFKLFPKKRVIYLKICPSPEMKKFRQSLSEQLLPITNPKDVSIDKNKKFNFHATVAINDIAEKFDEIQNYLNGASVRTNGTCEGITLLNKGKIDCEFDLVQRRMLTRQQVLNKMRNRDVAEPRNHRYGSGSSHCTGRGQIRQDATWGGHDGQAHDSDAKGQVRARQGAARGGRREAEITFEGVPGDSTFLFSDTHFDHTNIIKYCNRPFRSADSMNDALIKNWNRALRNGGRVFFLGDMTFGRRHRSIDYWLSKLSGEICFIRGNHDTDPITKATVIHTMHGIEYDGYRLLLMHDPERPAGYDGWIVHGDKHNNSPKSYPFVNAERRSVNVCAEMVCYEPLSVSELVSHIRAGSDIKTRPCEDHQARRGRSNRNHDARRGRAKTSGAAHLEDRKSSKYRVRDDRRTPRRQNRRSRR